MCLEGAAIYIDGSYVLEVVGGLGGTDWLYLDTAAGLATAWKESTLGKEEHKGYEIEGRKGSEEDKTLFSYSRYFRSKTFR